MVELGSADFQSRAVTRAYRAYLAQITRTEHLSAWRKSLKTESAKQSSSALPGKGSDVEDRQIKIGLLAFEVFEDAQTTSIWLKSPNLALDGLPPLDLIQSTEGFERVRNLLQRVLFGVLA